MIQHITFAQYKDLVTQKVPHILLDVRGKIEWDQGHVEGALLLPHFLVPIKASEILPQKDIPVIVYCQTGGRSQKACESLVHLGYSHVMNVSGGFETYTQE